MFFLAWVPIIQEMQNGQLYLYIQDAASNLAPPIAAVYIMAVIFKRVNEPGAFWSLMIGLLIGLTRMIVTLFYMEPSCGQEDLRPAVVKIHYMYFAIFLFWVTVAICIVISLFTEAPKNYLVSGVGKEWIRNETIALVIAAGANYLLDQI